MLPTELDAVPSNLLIVVMGVSGAGKSTLGNALAKALGTPYVEGDDLHPKSNVEKMSSGHPLDDIDREPWLESIRNTAEHMVIEMQGDSRTKDRSGAVIGCSALKKYYRDILRGLLKPAKNDPQSPEYHLEHAKPSLLITYFVFIDGPKEILMDRMEKRADHYMKASMLDSQLSTLETPIEEGVVTVSLNDPTNLQVTQALDGLSRFPDFTSWLDDKRSS